MPVRASILVTGLAMLTAIVLPIERLATLTSLITLVIFSAVNLSLLAIKWRNDPPPVGVFLVPAAGALSCLSLFLIGLMR